MSQSSRLSTSTLTRYKRRLNLHWVHRCLIGLLLLTTVSSVAHAQTATPASNTADSAPTEERQGAAEDLNDLESSESSEQIDPAQAYNLEIDAQVETLLAQMSVKERVGQLFVTTFPGDNIELDGGLVAADSDIAMLIHRYHIGGVILEAEHHNILNDLTADGPTQVARLSNQLQAAAYGRFLPLEQALPIEPPTASVLDALDVVTRTIAITGTAVTAVDAPSAQTDTAEDSAASVAATDAPTAEAVESAEVSSETLSEIETPLSMTSITLTELITRSIAPTDDMQLPLLIGVRQQGNGPPSTSLRRGFTPLPSQMALGATWQPELVEEVGAVVGRELNAVGINLLLGPNLDIYETPVFDSSRSVANYFGSNPFWVGKMGSAYIAGVHAGSSNSVATVAMHFPGRGGSDRDPTQEIATIQKSMEELRRTELPPFFTITQNPSSLLSATGTSGATDLLMTSHLRYSGLQGNEQERGPISLTPSLRFLLGQREFEAWRTRGLVMSDSLGVPAIRRFYDPSLADFPHRRIAFESFASGHDLLYIDDFSLDGEWATQQRNLIDTLTFFAQRYRDDVGFASDVDNAVRRILRLKLSLYSQPRPLADAQLNEIDPPSSTAVQTDTQIVTQTSTQADTQASAEPTAATDALSGRTAALIPLERVITTEAQVNVITAQSEQANFVVNQVARTAMTVLHPDTAGDQDLLPPAPRADDQILIVVDSRQIKECERCRAELSIKPDAIPLIIDRLYGASETSTGQLNKNVDSVTLNELQALFEARAIGDEESAEQRVSSNDAASSDTAAPTAAAAGTTGESTAATGESQNAAASQDAADPNAAVPGSSVGNGSADAADVSEDAGTSTQTNVDGDAAVEAVENEVGIWRQKTPAEVEALITQADWIVFATLGVGDGEEAGIEVVKQFLNNPTLTSRTIEQRPQRLIAFTFSAPIYLDATEISRLSAYYAAYSRTQPFLEEAVRTLFRASTPESAPPISVPGTRYSDLAVRLQPRSVQALPLVGSTSGGTANGSTALTSDAPQEQRTLPVGTVINLIAGPVVDRNGYPVVDNTEVRFRLSYEGEELVTLADDPAFTIDGFASRTVVLERGGVVRLWASSGEAVTRDPLLVNVTAPVQESASATGTAVGAEQNAPAATIEGGSTVESVAEGNFVEQEVDSATQPESPVAVSNGSVENRVLSVNNAAVSQAPSEPLRRVDLITLALAVATILVTLIVLFILTNRIMPPTLLVPNMLWAASAALIVYILYGVGWLPGATWVQSELRYLGVVPIVFVAMLVPLLWRQLRSEQ